MEIVGPRRLRETYAELLDGLNEVAERFPEYETHIEENELRFPRWLLPTADNDSRMVIRSRIRP